MKPEDYCVHKVPPLDCILNQMNLFLDLTSSSSLLLFYYVANEPYQLQ